MSYLGVLLVKILNHIYLKETTEFISRSFMLVRNFVLKNYSFASLEFFRDSCLNRDCYQPKYFRPSKRNSQPLTYLKSPVGCFPLHHPCCQLQGVAKKCVSSNPPIRFVFLIYCNRSTSDRKPWSWQNFELLCKNSNWLNDLLKSKKILIFSTIL